MVSETIWTCKEKNENNVSKVCILVISETIWNYRETIKTSMYLKHAFLWNLKRFGTVGKRGKHENKDAYACNMTRFDTIF